MVRLFQSALLWMLQPVPKLRPPTMMDVHHILLSVEFWVLLVVRPLQEVHHLPFVHLADLRAHGCRRGLLRLDGRPGSEKQ